MIRKILLFVPLFLFLCICLGLLYFYFDFTTGKKSAEKSWEERKMLGLAQQLKNEVL